MMPTHCSSRQKFRKASIPVTDSFQRPGNVAKLLRPELAYTMLHRLGQLPVQPHIRSGSLCKSSRCVSQLLPPEVAHLQLRYSRQRSEQQRIPAACGRRGSSHIGHTLRLEMAKALFSPLHQDYKQPRI
eukprot:gnl/TRDRNA2_/TRDRNA2_209948_c0_seq1.p1 gnl/TRDRNA2_/TRDRNA2_209948_c0~~gnl/TRDRNA2_/TRDRNA2_209948_c0_seq1.p1  ORF type:complete len:129 (-),score=7.66 gnl/TRDRNA2_/TRDRNA2_209948_c0_seq1:121-507(-)